MKRIILVTSLSMMMMLFPGIPGVYAQQQGTYPQGQGWYCPWNQMGGGMRREWGGGMHRGWGRGYCCGMGQNAANYNPQGQPVTVDQTKQMLEDYVNYKRNPNLKVGEISDKGDIFEATITTRDGSLVERIQVDKKTGWFRNVS